MIEIQDLRFQYHGSDFQLSIPRLSIPPGARLALVGPSGSGKTTLLYLLAGVYSPQHGTIRIGDLDLARLNDTARRDFRIRSVGLVFQDFELLEYLNVRENILLPYFINRRLRVDTTVRQAADGLAESLGLGDKLRRPIGRLSQGEKQRVAICRALLPGPRLLLADEPTGNLDPPNKRRILRLLVDQAARTGATLLFVTHDHSLLDSFEQVLDVAQFHRSGAEG